MADIGFFHERGRGYLIELARARGFEIFSTDAGYELTIRGTRMIADRQTVLTAEQVLAHVFRAEIGHEPEPLPEGDG